MGLSFFQCMFFCVCISCYLVDCLSVFVIQSLSLCLFFPFCHSLPLSLKKCVYDSLFLSLFLYFSLFLSLSVSLSLCVCLSVCLSLSLSLSLCLSVSLSLCLKKRIKIIRKCLSHFEYVLLRMSFHLGGL